MGFGVGVHVGRSTTINPSTLETEFKDSLVYRPMFQGSQCYPEKPYSLKEGVL